MKKSTVNSSLKFVPSSLCLLGALMASNAQAGVYTWDPQGVTSANYTGDLSGTWDDSATVFDPANEAGGTASPVAWSDGNDLEVAAGVGSSTPAFTITMDVDHTITGFWNGELANEGCQVTIDGTGTLNLAAGALGFGLYAGSAPSVSTFDVDLGGSGTMAIESAFNNGALNLNGDNSAWSGGVDLGYGGSCHVLLGFNNNNSFGTGAIKVFYTTTGATSPTLTAETAGLNIANQIVVSENSKMLQLVGNGITTFSGGVSLGANSITFSTTGGAINESGAITGTGGLTKAGAGVLSLSHANSYTGATAITAGTLQMGIANAIASSSHLAMGGGTLDLNGFNQVLSSTTISLSAASTIDFSSGGTLDLADSHTQTWSGTLNLIDYAPGDLKVGTDVNGLTTAQLADIEFNGVTGMAGIDSNGNVYMVPEPSTAALGLLGGLSTLGMMWNRRRKA